MLAWEAFVREQEFFFGKEVVDQWLRPLKVLHYDACNIFLEASNAFQSIWFEEHVRPRLKTGLSTTSGAAIKVHLKVANEPVLIKTKRNDPVEEVKPQKIELSFEKNDERCRLDNFVSGTKNSLPHRLLMELCCPPRDPSASLGNFNPIYLYGRTGTGKSHLLTAVVNAMQAKGVRSRYARSESFTEHMIKAIRAGEMHSFREMYRNVDLLALDDVQDFARKSATQEELFHTFNALHVTGKQILLGSVYPPSGLQHIEQRLVSRFEWGIVLELQPLEGAEYAQLLRYKAATMGFPLPERLAIFLLESFPNNAKTLIRALEALILRTHLKGVQITTLSLVQAKHVLEDLIQEEGKKVLTPETILWRVAEHYGIKIADLTGKSQNRECCVPRQIAAYLCRELLKMPYKKIGEIFQRDHSTMMTSIKQVEKQLNAENQELSPVLREIRQVLETGKDLVLCQA